MTIKLPIRYVLELRKKFRRGDELDVLKSDLQCEIDKDITRVVDYYYDIDNVFLRLINMSLEEIIYDTFTDKDLVEIK